MNTPKVVIKPYIKLRKLFRKKKKPAGLPPGTPVYTGEYHDLKVTVNLLDFNETGFDEKTITQPEETITCTKEGSISWLDVEGLNDVPFIQKLCESVGLHPLVIEDILNVEQRAKMEEYEGYIYIVLKMFHTNHATKEVVPEQVSIVLSRHFVLTFQEGVEGDTFHDIRERIRNNKGIIRKMTSDYLVYSIIDSIIDSYFSILEIFGDRIEQLEEELVNSPQKSTLTEIYKLKREMLYIRKSVWPLREAISRLEREESDLITRGTHLYLRDVYDHTINVLDTIETYRDMLSGMIDIYLSSISNKLNETMKFLAGISTIFIPMTLIASIYGMNFELIPELQWAHGYWFALGLMAAVGLSLFIYFKRKKWV